MVTGLLPALEVGELCPGEISEDLELALEVVRAGEPCWGQAGRRFRVAVEAVAALIDAGAGVLAARLRRPGVDRFHAGRVGCWQATSRPREAPYGDHVAAVVAVLVSADRRWRGEIRRDGRCQVFELGFLCSTTRRAELERRLAELGVRLLWESKLRGPRLASGVVAGRPPPR